MKETCVPSEAPPEVVPCRPPGGARWWGGHALSLSPRTPGGFLGISLLMTLEGEGVGGELGGCGILLAGAWLGQEGERSAVPPLTHVSEAEARRPCVLACLLGELQRRQVRASSRTFPSSGELTRVPRFSFPLPGSTPKVCFLVTLFSRLRKLWWLSLSLFFFKAFLGGWERKTSKVK